VAVDYLVTFRSTGAIGEQYANTICVHDTADTIFGAQAILDMLDTVDTWLTAKYVAMLPSSVVLDELHGFRIPATYGDASEVAGKAIATGGTLGAGDGKMPRETSLILALRSESTSRRHQGRLYLPSPRDSALLGSTSDWLTSTVYWTRVATFGQALLDGKDYGIGQHLSTRIYSRRQHIEGTGDKTKDVKTYIRRPRPHWLRRRVTAP